jgi:GNAT superfamily N-acetyltransferase
LIEGAPAGPDAATKELAFRPPWETPEDVVCFGVLDGDRIIAFAQLVPSVKPSEWWLGLLLLDPSARSRGLGEAIHREVLEWLATRGATMLWIGVLTQNEAAERFWRRLGYEERNRQPYVADTGFESTMIVMTLRTTPSSPSD